MFDLADDEAIATIGLNEQHEVGFYIALPAAAGVARQWHGVDAIDQPAIETANLVEMRAQNLMLNRVLTVARRSGVASAIALRLPHMAFSGGSVVRLADGAE